MSLIIISDKKRITLKKLAHLVLKWIFDNKHCNAQDLHTINEQMDLWYTHVINCKTIRKEMWGECFNDSLPIGEQGTQADEAHFFLCTLAKWLDMDEKGEWAPTKDSWRINNIDYRHTARFGFLYPEMFSKDTFKKAEAMLKQNMKDHPEYYRKEG